MELTKPLALKELTTPTTDSVTISKPLSRTTPEVIAAASPETHCAISNRLDDTLQIDVTDSLKSQDAGPVEDLAEKNTSETPIEWYNFAPTGSIVNWSTRQWDGLRAWLVCASEFVALLSVCA